MAVTARVTSNCVTDSFCNRVTFTFDLLTCGSMHVEQLLQSICVPSLVLIAQAFSFHTVDKQTEATECLNHTCGYTDGVGNEDC